MRRFLLLLAVAGVGCGARPDCDRDPVEADEASVIEVGVVDVCPWDILRFRPADGEIAKVQLATRHDVQLRIERNNGRRTALDAGDKELSFVLDGPCYSPDLDEWLPRTDAYDVLVASVPVDGRGAFVDVVSVELSSCLVFGQDAVTTPGLE